MNDHHIINERIFEERNVALFRQDFNTAIPFRYIVIDDFLNESFANRLLDHFPGIEMMKTHYSGMNERKAEDSNFEKLDAGFSQLNSALAGPGFIKWMESVTSLNGLNCIEDRLGCGLHQGANNSFLDIHIDYNIHPVKKMQRRLNLLVFLNAPWKPEWGGDLEFWDSNVKNCVQKIAPLFNRAVIFECSEISFHGYSTIHVPDHITRKSYYHYYFSGVEEKISYHDTVFKTRPKDSLIKKATTPVKEYAKNLVKKILLRTGFEKLIK